MITSLLFYDDSRGFTRLYHIYCWVCVEEEITFTWLRRRNKKSFNWWNFIQIIWCHNFFSFRYVVFTLSIISNIRLWRQQHDFKKYYVFRWINLNVSISINRNVVSNTKKKLFSNVQVLFRYFFHNYTNTKKNTFLCILRYARHKHSYRVIYIKNKHVFHIYHFLLLLTAYRIFWRYIFFSGAHITYKTRTNLFSSTQQNPHEQTKI